MDFIAKTTDEMTNMEIRHMNTVKELAGECLVLLENDGALPITNPGKVALYGNGARHTVKGGDGSGDVNTRTNVNICDGLEEAGFDVSSKGWLDRYDEIYYPKLSDYLAEVDRLAKERNTAPINIFFEMAFEAPALPEITEEDVAEADTDTAIFVISRDSSEGRDRTPAKGDYYLTDEEDSLLDFVIHHYDKVIVLLNVGAVIDMSRLKHRAGVSAILLVGQVGNFTGNIVADAITGKTNPSGKLVDTWAKSYEDYPFATEFSSLNGNTDDKFYKEGIYVDYRYFDSFGIQPLYPFGYGRSYTTFNCETIDVTQQGAEIKVTVLVTNTGFEFSGKQVIQVYFSAPEGRIDRPYQELAGYAKSGLIRPGESQVVTVTFPIENFRCYDDEIPATVIPEGDYLIRVGTSSRETKIEAVLTVPETVVKDKFTRLL